MAVQRHRTWSDAPIVVDAANVAGSEVLPGCGKFCWQRLELVRRAWREQVDPDATFVLVMDNGPIGQLGERCCKPLYRNERRAGAVIEVDFADPEVLRIAEETDAAIITSDLYKDHRRTHPWIDGNDSQFFGWAIDGGTVRIVARDMGIPSDFSKTRAEERAELKERGVNLAEPTVERAFRQTYRCDTQRCWLHQYDPGHFTGVPDLSDPQSPKCTACGQPLVALGETPRLVQVKFANLDRTRLDRLTLSPGDSVAIGREASAELVATLLGAAGELISRRHAQLDWDGSRLMLVDLGSKNGTTVRRWAGKQRGHEPAVRVGEPISLGPRDEACLAGALLITRSARTFMLEAERRPVSPPVGGPPTVAQGGANR